MRLLIQSSIPNFKDAAHGTAESLDASITAWSVMIAPSALLAGAEMKKIIIVIGLLGSLFSGCASGTGVVPMGPDSYMISKQGGSAFVASGKLKAEVYAEASFYCKDNGKEMMPVSSNEIHGGIGVFPQAELDFMCLSPGDPQLTRVRMEPVAPHAPSLN